MYTGCIHERRSQRCLSRSPSGPFAASRCDSPERPLLAREASQEQREEFSWSVHDCEANGSRPAQRHVQMFRGVQWSSSGKWLKMLSPGGRKKKQTKKKLWRQAMRHSKRFGQLPQVTHIPVFTICTICTTVFTTGWKKYR